MAARLKYSFKKKPDLFSVICGIFLFIASFGLIFLFLYAFVNSFKGLGEYIDDPLGFTKDWRIDNYSMIIDYFFVKIGVGANARIVYIEGMVLNTLGYCFGCTLCSLVVCSVTAYATARFDYKFSSVIYAFNIMAMSLTVVGSQASELKVIKDLHIYDTFMGNFILKANFLGLYYMVLHAIFSSVPKAYSEAAEIDGASNFRVFLSVMLPLAKNTLFTIGLIYFIGYWNDYQTPLLYLPSHPTIALGLFNFTKSSIPDIASPTIKLGACIVVFMPIFILFLIFQKRIIGNVSLGGIKE